MNAAVYMLDLDRDPEVYLALHGALDESAADALLDERELSVREAVRDVVAREVVPRAATADRDHRFVHESYQSLAEAGLAGLIFPEGLSGTGDTTVAYAAAVEEIAAGCAATSLVHMTQMHAAYPIMVAGSDELARRHIPGLLSGAAYGALAITEPDAGSDVASLRTVAVPRAGGYRLTGAKTFITTGDRADVIVCFATTDRSRGRDGITAFVLDGRWPGLSRGAPLHKLGMHGSTTVELFFDQVEVPADHLLGEPGRGWRVVLNAVTKSRISAAAQGVGLARSAYARTLSALSRLHGAPLSDEAAFALAALRGTILQSRLLLYGVARRDAKVTQIYDGTNEIQRLLIARDTARAERGRG